jgi:UDP-N-acetylmuramyl tripeptide synthase
VSAKDANRLATIVTTIDSRGNDTQTRLRASATGLAAQAGAMVVEHRSKELETALQEIEAFQHVV